MAGNDPYNWTALGTGIGALIAGFGTGVAAVLGVLRKRAGLPPTKKQAVDEKSLGSIYDRMTKLEIESNHILKDIEEAKSENKMFRTMLHEMDKKLSEIHGMLSTRREERDK